MQSSSHSESPGEWTGTRKRPRDIVSNAIVVVIAAASVGFGVISGMTGNAIALRYSVLFGIMMILTVALGASMRKQNGNLAKVTHTADLGNGSRATEIRYSKTQFVILLALMTCCAAFFILAATEILVSRTTSVASAAGAVLGMIGLFLLSFPVMVASGRITRGGLLLSEHGIAQRGWSFESRLSWADVAGIKPAYNGHPIILLVAYTNAQWTRRYTTPLWKIDRLPPVPMIEIDCRKLDVDPAVLLSFLSAYVDIPNNRIELGTPEARARAQESDRYR